jgi:hypothetical protein
MFKKIRPSKDTTSTELKNATYVLYKTLNVALPITLLILVRVDLIPLAVLIALFSKWRVFTVRPRHLLANLRTNATDIIVKLSTLAFIVQADTFAEQSIWTVWYIIWLIVIKPASSKNMVSFQAAAGHILGVSAVFLFSNTLTDFVLLFFVWLIALTSARHFLSSYEEGETKMIASLWGFFVLQMAWVLNKWLLVYVFIPQLIFIIGVIGYGLASIYNAHKTETLKPALVRQQIAMALLVIVALVVIADWRGSI